MTRLSVTLDPTLESEVSSFAADLSLARAEIIQVWETKTVTELDPAFVIDLIEALRDLGEEPSQSAIMREALDFFLTTLRRQRMAAHLESGYAQLASNPERDSAIRFVTARAAAAVADED